MAQKLRNPLAQALGIVLQNIRDKMGGISSSEIASHLGLAASHYRMIEAGSAILQPSRAIRVVQTFDTIEFIPLCRGSLLQLPQCQDFPACLEVVEGGHQLLEVEVELKIWEQAVVVVPHFLALKIVEAQR